MAPEVGGGLACQVAGRDRPQPTCSCLRARWQAAVGQRADAGGRRGLRGGRLQCRWQRGRLWLARGLTQAAGVCCEAGGFDAAGDVAACGWLEARRSGGRGLQGGRLQCRWRRGHLWLARGLMQVAGAGCEVGSFSAAGDMAACGWLEG